MGRLTQRDIARALGVSLKTVQRALNRPETVAPDQLERIKRFAERHGYVPNRSARALRERRIYRIVIFTMGQPAYFWDDVGLGARVAAEQIEQFGFQFVHRRVADSGELLQVLRESERPDCVGLMNFDRRGIESVVAWIAKREIPFLTLNFDILGSNRFCYIGPDYEKHGELAGEFIRQIAGPDSTVVSLTIDIEALTPKRNYDNTLERLRGFRRALNGPPTVRHLEVPIIPDVEGGIRIIRRLEQRNTILFCLPPLPQELLDHVRQLPQHVRPKLIGFDLSPEIVDLLHSGVITAEIFQNPALQGYGAVKLMEMYLETGRPPSQDRYLVSPQIILNSNAEQRSYFDLITAISEPWSGTVEP